MMKEENELLEQKLFSIMEYNKKYIYDKKDVADKNRESQDNEGMFKLKRTGGGFVS